MKKLQIKVNEDYLTEVTPGAMRKKNFKKITTVSTYKGSDGKEYKFETINRREV